MSSASSHLIRVLYLEDNPRDMDMVGRKLEVGGVSCEIVKVDCRENFEAALQGDPFDLVLCDYNLPDYDGLSAMERAKQLQPNAPVIIISGSVGEEEAVKCLHAGATDYLLKDRLERLVPAVRRAIREAEERRRRARAEEALQERERRLSSIFEAVADVIFDVAVEGPGTYRVTSINPAFVTTTGLTSDQIIGKRIDEVLPTPTTSPDHYAQAIRERRTVRWEQTVEFPKGRVTGEVSVTPVLDETGTCARLVGTVHDITKRRQLEAQLRQAQKMESVGQLAGGIAHDFNNLLTVINGNAELVLTALKEGDHRQVENDLEEIRRAGERAASLTRQLLTFSRKQIIQPQIFDLNGVVAEIGAMLRRLLGEDIELVLTPSGARATVKADRGQVEQVIANLAVNARDAMPQGGTLTIETRVIADNEVHIREQSEGATAPSYVALAVRDSGTGMDDATRSRIFEPFFTTKGPGKGTGLGLSTVYGIVKQSGGFIDVDTEPSRGSCFTIYLPSVTDTASKRAPEAVQGKTRGNETILIVEDIVGLRRLMTRALEAAGYTVLVAGSGEEALSVLERHGQPIHLMVTDVVMPGMSGPRLAERMAQSGAETQVLYMSGYTDDVVLRHGIVVEGVPFINKPFGTADLLRKVREVLDQRLQPLL